MTEAANPATPGPTLVGATLPADLSSYERRLRDTFGYPQLRDGQAETLRMLAQRDVLAVMPTGSGKSLCYQLPALEVGRTLVISPLIALMQDQVESLTAAGVPAAFINSNVGRAERNARYLDFVQGRTALLYLAPEGLRNPRLLAGLRQHGINLLAIDEAHCISQWGHDFRPDYLTLGSVREQLGEPRTLALTATADPRVRTDILEQLGIAGQAGQVVTSVDRPNLHFSAVSIEDETERRAWLRRFVRERPGRSGIVYARTRRGVEELAEELRRAGVSAEAYHAGIERERRAEVQRRFTRGETAVIVATIAFGMGIDKPDVRYVVHYNMPGRLEAYYQEAGRAGRDGEPAECVLLHSRRDRAAQQHFIDDAHPDDDAVRALWTRWVSEQALVASPDGDGPPFDASERQASATIVTALRESGLLSPSDMALRSRDAAAPIDTRSITEHRRYAEGRLAAMAEYVETTSCRRALILRYFGEQAPDRCEACDRCLGTAVAPSESYPADLYDSILALRERLATASGRAPYEVFETRTARELATDRPAGEAELLRTWGIAQRRADWFGAQLLRLIAEWERAHPDAPPRSARAAPAEQRAARERDAYADVGADDPLYGRLREWRASRARSEGVPAFTLFSDRTLRELVATRPPDEASLLRVWGLGDTRVRRFGGELLATIAEGEGEGDEPR